MEVVVGRKSDEKAEIRHGLSKGDKVKLVVAIMQNDLETADELVERGMAENPKEWSSFGRWVAEFRVLSKDEGAQEQLRRYLSLDLQRMDDQGLPWRERCMPYIIYDLRQVGRADDTTNMMSRCQKQVEERFKAQYLCPCTWYTVVQYTILDGRMDEAVQRADQWLTNGDSSFDLHIDSIFSELKDRPEYDDFLARNQAQIERQRDIYLAGHDQDEARDVAGGD